MRLSRASISALQPFETRPETIPIFDFGKKYIQNIPGFILKLSQYGKISIKPGKCELPMTYRNGRTNDVMDVNLLQ